MSRPNHDSPPAFSARNHPNLEWQALPIVGQRRRTPITAAHAFWRNFALVLIVHAVVRLALDLLG